MPTKISQLETATDVTASDLIQVIDIEDTGMAVSGTNKKCTAQLLAVAKLSRPLQKNFTKEALVRVKLDF